MTLHWGQIPKCYQNVSSPTFSFCESGVRQSSLYTSPRGVVLRKGQWCSPVDICHWWETLFWSLWGVVEVCYWHLEGRGQGCHYTSHNAQDGHTTNNENNDLASGSSGAEVEKHLGSSTSFILLCNTGFRPSPSATFFTPSVSVSICKMFTWTNRHRDISAPNPWASLKKKDILL